MLTKMLTIIEKYCIFNGFTSIFPGFESPLEHQNRENQQSIVIAGFSLYINALRCFQKSLRCEKRRGFTIIFRIMQTHFVSKMLTKTLTVCGSCAGCQALSFPAPARYILNGCNAGVLLLQGGEAGKRFRAILPGVLLAQLVGLRTVRHPARDRHPVGNSALITRVTLERQNARVRHRFQLCIPLRKRYAIVAQIVN
nr:MAG TPA: hypothetical protein [Caudoviricetes sp.]